MAAGCSSTPGSAQTQPAPQGGAPQQVAAASATTIWDGVFTSAQADRGETLARSNCFTCHGQREWANPSMFQLWGGQPIAGLYENIRATMPYDSPGRLSRQEYADIVSYILELNGVPAGQAELPTTPEGLQGIQVQPRPNP
jgi:mono/diheme cytochrome c family protein